MTADRPQNPFRTSGRSRRGEPFVWLTAAGLAFGVAITVGLLALIVCKGAGSFWPRRLVEVSLDGGNTAGPVAGFVVQERIRRDAEGMPHEEIQVFRGNRELFGEKFVFLDRAHIRETTQPEDLWLVERLEGGTVIGRPQSIKLADGSEIPASDPRFASTLQETLRDTAKQRKQLGKVERDSIGAINRQIEELRLEEKKEGTNPALETRRASLQQEYENLAAAATLIRQQLDAGALELNSADGRSIRIPAGGLLHVFEPNRAGFFARLGEAIRRAWVFLTNEPREANTEGGVFPAIFGTVVMTIAMSLFVTPLGVIAAIYLREYAKQGPLVRMVRISVNNLAGVPSIVFGVFGLAFFVYFIGGVIDEWLFPESLPNATYGTGGILWASLTLALLTLPVMIVATEEALAAVPRGVREAALACGASKWQSILRVVLPASLPGILTGVILAMARGAGEVAPLMLVGVVKLAPELPLDLTAPFVHPERQFMHLGFHIYDLGFQSPDSEAAKPMVFATTLLLISVVVVMNLAAILVRNRLRRRQLSNSF